MLKIIQKVFLLLFFVCSFVFPMKQVVRVPLARTLNQTAFFRNSLIVKCPVFCFMAIMQLTMMPLLLDDEKENEAREFIAKVRVRDSQNATIDNQELIKFRNKLDEIEEELRIAAKLELSLSIAEVPTIVQDKTSQFVKDHASLSSCDLRIKQQAAEEKVVHAERKNMNNQLQYLRAEQKEYSETIEQAQKIIDERKD